jgi:hypothetical protein
MHKFELSIYKGLWEDKKALTTILQNPDLIKANNTFWREDFSVDPNITETNAEGEAVFTSRMRKLDVGTLMDMRAPLGDSIPEDAKGMEAYSGTIQEFISKGYVETAEMREYKRRLFAEIGDVALVGRFVEEVLQPRVDSANQTLSHMAAQLISTGKIIYNQGVGLKGSILKAAIPTENFLKAGEKVWTDSSALLLDQMRKIEEDFRDKTGLAIPMQWKITRKMFNNVFLKNEQVVKWIKDMYLVESGQIGVGTTNLSGLVVNEENFNKYIQKVQGLSPIKIVDEKQNDLVNGTVNGWKDGVAVFCPAGKLGLVRRTTIADVRYFTEEYINPSTRFVFASALDGCAFVRNSVVPNGVLKEWHSDLVLAATPTLDEFLYHYIIDTTTANS